MSVPVPLRGILERRSCGGLTRTTKDSPQAQRQGAFNERSSTLGKSMCLRPSPKRNSGV